MNRCAVATSVALLVATLFAVARSRPVDPDPLMALPSAPANQRQQQYVVVEQHQPAPQQAQQAVEIQYIQVAQPQQQAGEQETSVLTQEQYQQLVAGQQPPAPPQQQQHAQPAGSVQLEAPYQLVHVQAPPGQHQHEEINCNKRHELTAVSSLLPAGAQPEQQRQQQPRSAEYPGEIIYLGGERRDYAPKPAARGDNSELPATILTEVPVNELPLDVLVKLRREYGVKVVATRERPGANLVINCDEYSQQHNSICNRQSSQASSYELPLVEPSLPLAGQPYGAGLVPASESEPNYYRLAVSHQALEYHPLLGGNEPPGAQLEYGAAPQAETRAHQPEYRYLNQARAVDESPVGQPQHEDPTAASLGSVQPPESHTIEYIQTEARPSAEEQPSAEPYGARTATATAAGEQVEPVTQNSPVEPQTSAGPGQSAEAHEQQQQQHAEQNASEAAGAASSPETDPNHGFDEQPKSSAEQEQPKTGDSESVYQDARHS